MNELEIARIEQWELAIDLTRQKVISVGLPMGLLLYDLHDLLIAVLAQRVDHEVNVSLLIASDVLGQEVRDDLSYLQTILVHLVFKLISHLQH
jgi:predicted proteasome-type protease